jgi:tetratricopeptide (TPR) repeat protein
MLAALAAAGAGTLFQCEPASSPPSPSAAGGTILTRPPVPDYTGLEPPLARLIQKTANEIEANPDDSARWGKLGGLYLIHDFTEEAVVCLEQAAQRDPTEFRWPYLVGRAVMLEDHEASMAALNRARTLRADFAPLEILLGRGLFLRGEFDAAEAAFRRGLALDDTLARGHLGLGQIALERGDATRAIAALERARELSQGSQELSWALATAYRRDGNTAAAARAEAAAASATARNEPLPDPIHQELTARLGVTMARRAQRVAWHVQQGDNRAALAEWEAAVRADPDWAEPVIQLGLLRAELGDTDGAIEALQRGLRIDPENHQTRNNLGGLLIERGEIAEGLALLRASTAAMPEDAEARINLAIGLARVGQRTEAIAMLAETLRLAPGHPRARFEHGRLLAMDGRLAAAIAEFEIVVDLEPTHPVAHTNLARALAQLARFDEAVAVLRLAHDRFPGRAEITVGLGWILATAPDESVRDGVEAMSLLDPILRQRRDPRLLDTYAAAQAATGDFAAAVHTADEAIGRLRSAGPAAAVALAEIQSRRDLYAREEPYVTTLSPGPSRP